VKADCVIYRAATERDTIALGRRLGRLLRPGDLLVLEGGLGSGKTCLAKGLAAGLEVPADQVVNSPSFALVNEYMGRCPFFHMDIYRLERVEDLLAAGLDEYFYQNGVVAMEWGLRWPAILPEGYLVVSLNIQADLTREIVLKGTSGRGLKIIENLESCLTEGG